MLWKVAACRIRTIARRLVPPGNRSPIEDSGEQRPGLGSGDLQSQAGQKAHTLDQWQGGP
jgi:hypothetical protein